MKIGDTVRASGKWLDKWPSRAGNVGTVTRIVETCPDPSENIVGVKFWTGEDLDVWVGNLELVE